MIAALVAIFGFGFGAAEPEGQKYDVKIIVYPFKSMVLDTVVEVR